MFANINEIWNNDPVKETTKRLSNDSSKSTKKIQQPINLSDASLSLISENTSKTDIDSDFLSFAYNNNKNDSVCTHCTKHLSQCNICFAKISAKINDKINEKVNKKFDEMLMEHKMKQLQNIMNTSPNHNNLSNSWKEIFLIIIGIIIIIFIILLVLKVVYK